MIQNDRKTCKPDADFENVYEPTDDILSRRKTDIRPFPIDGLVSIEKRRISICWEIVDFVEIRFEENVIGNGNRKPIQSWAQIQSETVAAEAQCRYNETAWYAARGMFNR